MGFTPPTLADSIRIADNRMKYDTGMRANYNNPAAQRDLNQMAQGGGGGGGQEQPAAPALKPGQWDPAASTDVDPVTGRRFWKKKGVGPLAGAPDPQQGLNPADGGVRTVDPAQSQAARNDMFYQHRKPQGLPQGLV